MITFSFTIARPSVTVKADGVLPSGITVLTGQSGSGKSTFIKCIAGLVKPTTGSIHCNETTWVDRDNKIWVPAQKRQVGYMPQGNIVFPHLALRNIAKRRLAVCLVANSNELLWDVRSTLNRLSCFLMSLYLL